ncbi:MAG: hypothetical protein JHD18_03820, partial [Rhodoferax sp.]|nr:hypothetical protein [Rhodoferax sp.]
MTMHPQNALIAFCLSLMLLTACGGGTSTTTTAANPPAGEQPNPPPTDGQPAGPNVPTTPTNEWVLDWSDEFNGDSLNSAVWT